MITINEAVLNILKKHKLKIICCERGTNGMLSNLLSSKEADVFLAGYIFNNPETITKVFETKPIEKEPQAFIYEWSIQALRLVKNADICLTAYLDNNTLHICLIFLDKNYYITKTLEPSENNHDKAAIETLLFLTKFLEKIDK